MESRELCIRCNKPTPYHPNDLMIKQAQSITPEQSICSGRLQQKERAFLIIPNKL